MATTTVSISPLFILAVKSAIVIDVMPDSLTIYEIKIQGKKIPPHFMCGGIYESYNSFIG
jgi:hypothetical protein